MAFVATATVAILSLVQRWQQYNEILPLRQHPHLLRQQPMEDLRVDARPY
jgi:hypothetical protein